ncbi:MAG TPA: alkaline phosphatase family protein, partial [Thermoanaerobaculia bacterium]|nr:alkaline phosphatase family protein [Thermoanaerobaculia bacterium]
MPAAWKPAPLTAVVATVVASVLATVLVALACTSTAPRTTGRTEAPTPLVVLSWDGAGDVIVDRMLEDGHLPHLAALIERGVAADHSVTSYPSKTAVGHAQLFTGAPPAVHGVTANEVPLLPPSEHTLLDHRRGFHAAQLSAEPLYVTAAKAGRSTVVLSATQSYPPEPHVAGLAAAGVAPHLYLSLSGFENRIARRHLWTAADATEPGEGWGDAATPGSREVAFEVGDCGADCRFFALADAAGERVRLRRGSRRDVDDELVLSAAAPAGLDRPLDDPFDPAAWSPPFRVRRGALQGNLYLRLFEPLPGEGFALYQRSVYALDGAVPAADLAALLDACPGFHDDAVSHAGVGLFGRPMVDGGDGSAERRLVELAAFDLASSACSTRFAAERWAPEALFDYIPWSDSAGHEWWGALEPSARGHDAELAARLWPYYVRVFALQDAWLGDIVAAMPGAVVALFSDHGMTPVDRYLHVEQVLADAGLLTWTAAGETDLAHTKAVAPYPEFGVRVNGTEWRQGTVPPAEREAVLDAVEAALLAV